MTDRQLVEQAIERAGSISGLARITGYSTRAIRYWLAGTRTPPPHAIRAFHGVSMPAPDPQAGLRAMLREARAAAGLTQQQLSERTGILRSAVSEIEHGHRDATPAEAAAWLAVTPPPQSPQ